MVDFALFGREVDVETIGTSAKCAAISRTEAVALGLIRHACGARARICAAVAFGGVLKTEVRVLGAEVGTTGYSHGLTIFE